jgi:hydrogenase maturation protease
MQPARESVRTLVIGVGNPLVTDDGVGLRVADAVRGRLADRENVDVAFDACGGLSLMERMIGYDRAVVVDAMVGGSTAGRIHRGSATSLVTRRCASAHDVDLATALRLGEHLGAHLPTLADIAIIGIEASDLETFGERCTPAVAEAIPRAVDAVLAALDDGR